MEKKFKPTHVQNEIIATVYFLYISLANKSHYLESLFVTTMKKVFFEAINNDLMLGIQYWCVIPLFSKTSVAFWEGTVFEGFG